MEGFEALAAGILGEVDDWLDSGELTMSHGTSGQSSTDLQDLHLIGNNTPLLLVRVPLRFLDICVCLLDSLAQYVILQQLVLTSVTTLTGNDLHRPHASPLAHHQAFHPGPAEAFS